jgi:hypothetical protein
VKLLKTEARMGYERARGEVEGVVLGEDIEKTIK